MWEPSISTWSLFTPGKPHLLPWGPASPSLSHSHGLRWGRACRSLATLGPLQTNSLLCPRDAAGKGWHSSPRTLPRDCVCLVVLAIYCPPWNLGARRGPLGLSATAACGHKLAPTGRQIA